MKYLSPIGVCFTTASNTEQSRGKIISGPQHIVLTWGTRAFAWDLLSIDISRVGKVPLDPSHHRMVWVVFAVWCCAHRPVGPLAILSWTMVCLQLEIENQHQNHLCNPFDYSYHSLVSESH